MPAWLINLTMPEMVLAPSLGPAGRADDRLPEWLSLSRGTCESIIPLEDMNRALAGVNPRGDTCTEGDSYERCQAVAGRRYQCRTARPRFRVCADVTSPARCGYPVL